MAQSSAQRYVWWLSEILTLVTAARGIWSWNQPFLTFVFDRADWCACVDSVSASERVDLQWSFKIIRTTFSFFLFFTLSQVSLIFSTLVMCSAAYFYIHVVLFASVLKKLSFYFTASFFFFFFFFLLFLNVWMLVDCGQWCTLVTVKPTLLSFHGTLKSWQ